MNEKTTIPKIIHYCWFGNEMPDDIKKYMSSWDMLKGYELKRWNETNCTFDENEFVRRAYKEKRYAYVCDYYRLKVLYEYGGIYLDTDCQVYKSFDDLLDKPAFLNFLFDSSIGAGIIGAVPHSPFIKSLLDIYENITFSEEPMEKGYIITEDGKFVLNRFVTCNSLYTEYILKHYPSFRLNNKLQEFDDFTIFPKELFEIGTITNKHYVIHYCVGSWRTNHKERAQAYNRVKEMIYRIPKVQIIIRKIRYKKMNKELPFYNVYLQHKKMR